jgi:hypothetical protein
LLGFDDAVENPFLLQAFDILTPLRIYHVDVLHEERVECRQNVTFRLRYEISATIVERPRDFRGLDLLILRDFEVLIHHSRRCRRARRCRCRAGLCGARIGRRRRYRVRRLGSVGRGLGHFVIALEDEKVGNDSCYDDQPAKGDQLLCLLVHCHGQSPFNFLAADAFHVAPLDDVDIQEELVGHTAVGIPLADQGFRHNDEVRHVLEL